MIGDRKEGGSTDLHTRTREMAVNTTEEEALLAICLKVLGRRSVRIHAINRENLHDINNSN